MRDLEDGCREESIRQWSASSDFRKNLKILKKAGRPKGSVNTPDFTDDPRTPFEALRMLMKITRKDWCELLQCSMSLISHIERVKRC